MKTMIRTKTPGAISGSLARPFLAVALVTIGLGASAHAACMPLALSMPSFLAASWVVSSGQSLQSQINTAAAGDNITVMSGTYNENITITNGLTIQGSGGIVAVTGSLTASNAALPVCLSDIAFGGNVGTGLTVNNCQNFRADRCNFVGGGNFNATNSTLYCYKDAFSSSVNFQSNTWTFQRCSVAGNLVSSTSIAKFIGSTNSGTFNHNQGEITIFQSTLNGGAGNNITLASTNNGWLCYSTIQGMNFIGGNVQVVGNYVGNAQIDTGSGSVGNFTYFASGCNATIRNNVFANDGPYGDRYNNIHARMNAVTINGDAGIVNIFNNTIYNVYQGININNSPGGVVIRGNIYYSPSEAAGNSWSVNTSASGVIIDCNDFTTAVNGGTQTGNINGDPKFTNTTWGATNFCALNAGSTCNNAGPTNDATFLNFDGSRNTMGAYGGHSYDPTGRTTTNPVVLSGTVSPTYVKQGQAVTISARAAVIAAP